MRHFQKKLVLCGGRWPHEAEQPRAYPVAAKFTRHLTKSLIDADFDISHSERLPRATGEGHAYGFVHHQLMTGYTAPIVPVMLSAELADTGALLCVGPRTRRCRQGVAGRHPGGVRKFARNDGNIGKIAK